jgi:hypothetical protein
LKSNGNSLDAVHIGSQYDANNSYFGGNIAEMSVWSRRLTDDEIAELYNSGSGLEIY